MRFVIVVFVAASLASVSLGQNASDSEATKQPTRYRLRDISEHDSPLQIIGKVLFQTTPAVLTYEVEAVVKNVSKKDVLFWSMLVRTSDGVLDFTSSNDYFFTGDVLASDDSAGVTSGPINLVAHPQGDTPAREKRHSSNRPVTASAEIEFVQFQDGSTWGDSDTETKAFQARRASFQKLQSLQKVYAQVGERAFLDALAEPTMLACVERIQTDCKGDSGDSSCARETIERMLDVATRRGFLEKP